MEQVIKRLKYATFVFDPEAKGFFIIPQGDNSYCSVMENELGESVVFMNKTYSFAFRRFVMRFSQKDLFRRRRRQGE